MTKIALLSDTHSFVDSELLQHLSDTDEVWHAGDFGSIEVIETLKKYKLSKGVYGNIDGTDIQSLYPLLNIFTCEEVKVVMQHIGGYPKKYTKGIKEIILKEEAKIFISGHSHILKIMYDQDLDCLHMNPGAAGKQGWHKVRTLIKFTIDGADIKDCKIVELGSR